MYTTTPERLKLSTLLDKRYAILKTLFNLESNNNIKNQIKKLSELETYDYSLWNLQKK